MRQQDFVCICSCFLQHEVRETTSNMLYPSAQVYLTHSEVFTYLLFSGHLFCFASRQTRKQTSRRKKIVYITAMHKNYFSEVHRKNNGHKSFKRPFSLPLYQLP